MIIQEIAEQSLNFLKKKGISSARRAVEEMLCHALSLKRMELYLDFQRPLNSQEVDSCRAILARLAKGEPIQYIVGTVSFYDCEIEVSPDVLIPRPETELLVDQIVKELKGGDLAGKTLWDVCCGSGCIGIALKRALPDLRVTLSDISSKALNQARKNAEKNGVEVEFLEGNLLEPFEEMTHYLVVNPPYISEGEYDALSDSVKLFEPRLALLGGRDGLDSYRAIARGFKKILRPGGKMWMEMGYRQGEAVKELFDGTGNVERDWSGHDRFFSLEIP